jgi:hypothetical protein
MIALLFNSSWKMIYFPCETESHKAKMSVRVQNGKKRDSTICEEEFHQPKPSASVKKSKLRDSTICEESHKNLCEKDTQKLSDVEDRPCEETSLSHMTISSIFSFDVMQVTEENEVVKYDQPPIFDEEDHVMPMDKGAEISLCFQHKDHIEGNNNANASHSSDATLVAFEDALVLGSFTTFAAPLHLHNLVKYDTYAYVASQDVEVIVHQNLCENEGHRAKLKASETKSELCDSTHCDLESINNANVRNTPHSNREFKCTSCEDTFETNILISTTSVFFPNMQVCNKNEGEMVFHNVTILIERDVKVANQLKQLYATQNMKYDEVIGKISETSSMILALPHIIQGTKNDLLSPSQKG